MATMETLDQVRTDFLNITATRYLSAAGLVIMLYDHLLTLDDEVEYVWKAKWSLPKTLFLVLRYMVPSAMIMYTYELSGIGEIHLSDTFCRGWFGSGLYLGIFSVSIGNFIVLLRLWVIWDRNIRLLLVTLSVFIATQIMTLAATTYMVVHWIPEVIFVEELHMCGMVAKPPLVMLWAPGLFFEVMVFVLASWNALSRPSIACPVARSVYRDGLGYFVLLATLRVLNLILSVVAPLSLMFLGIYFIWAATTVTVSRLLLNFRRLSTAHHIDHVQHNDEENPSSELSRQESRATVDKYTRVANSADGQVVQAVDTEEYELREGASARTAAFGEAAVSGASSSRTVIASSTTVVGYKS